MNIIMDAAREAVTDLMSGQPFYAQHLVGMVLQENTRIPAPAATDGYSRIMVNPPVMQKMYDARPDKKMPLTEAVGVVLMHEALHRVMLHSLKTRLAGRDPTLWNIAGDYLINGLLLRQGFDVSRLSPVMSMEEFAKGKGQGACLDRRLDLNWSTEMVYDHLAKMLPEPPPMSGQGFPAPPQDGDENESPGQGQGQGQDGDDENQGQHPMAGGDLFAPQAKPGDEGTGAPDDADVQSEVMAANVAAEAVAKGIGKLPSSLKGHIIRPAKPTVDWRRELARFAKASLAREDFSYRRRSRRMGADPRIIMPGHLSESLGPVVCLWDTSGSMSDREMDVIAGEVTEIFARLKPAEIIVVYTDARVQHVDRFRPGEAIKLRRHGCGGTDFRPAFRWVEENARDAECIILFTDGWGPFPAKKPRCPVLVGLTDPSGEEEVPHWGKVLPIKIMEK